MIELDGITVSLPAHRSDAATILDNIDLKISAGDWIALVGPNGSGKTTLLKTIAGLLSPVEGHMRTAGSDGEKLRVGFLFQEPDNQFVASSVGDELLMSLPPGVAASRIEAAAHEFSLGALLERNPHRLSGGEKQRLAFATVWLAQPQLLLLDEPTSYLDSVQSARLTEFVAAMNAGGVAVVWTMPRNSEVGQATRLVRLAGGKIMEETVPPPEPPATKIWADDAAPATPDASREVIVAFDEVSFDYGHGQVFGDLSFQIRAGERAAMWGHNGAGKSTVLGIIGGLLHPTTGGVQRRYRRPVADGQQQLFYLFQNPERLFFAETVHEEVAFGLRSLGVRSHEITPRVREALAAVELAPDKFETRMPFSLSAGEMRRAAFAIAWALRPRLLLLDEPTCGLDDDGHAVFRRLIDAADAGETTVVTASHDRGMLAQVADRVVSLVDPSH